MQGRLTGQKLRVGVETTCAHCGQPLRFELTDQMDVHELPDTAAPLVSIPIVDFKRLKDPSIIHAF